MRIDFNKKLVVFAPGDHTSPTSKENRCFLITPEMEERDYLSNYFYEECLKRGIQLITPDIYFGMKKGLKKIIFVRNDATSNITKILMRAGLRPGALMISESPLFACKFFWNLKKETEPFDYTFGARGLAQAVSSKTKFRPFIVPYFHISRKMDPNFSNKKYLAFIVGNKRIHKLRRLYVSVMNFLKPLPNFINRELYVDRLEAIRYFSRYSDFDLYGRGWDRNVRYRNSFYGESIRKSYRGEVSKKLDLLRNYKFSICFENSILGGWVTEKILDSLFAGCVPIYLGAPDITRYIPKNCFIDFRDFKNFEDLDKFLRSMDEKTYNRYIEAINSFMDSNQYNEYFGHEKFVRDMIEIFESY